MKVQIANIVYAKIIEYKTKKKAFIKALKDQGVLPCVHLLNFLNMKISVELITLPEEADSLIKMAQRERRNASHALESIDMQSENSEENAIRTQQELTVAQADLAASEVIIASLPEGKKKQDEITKKMGTELRIRKLTFGGSNTGTLAFMEKEFDATLLESRIARIDEYIQAVTARKAVL